MGTASSVKLPKNVYDTAGNGEDTELGEMDIDGDMVFADADLGDDDEITDDEDRLSVVICNDIFDGEDERTFLALSNCGTPKCVVWLVLVWRQKL
jgi:hypothetical protein